MTVKTDLQRVHDIAVVLNNWMHSTGPTVTLPDNSVVKTRHQIMLDDIAYLNDPGNHFTKAEIEALLFSDTGIDGIPARLKIKNTDAGKETVFTRRDGDYFNIESVDFDENDSTASVFWMTDDGRVLMKVSPDATESHEITHSGKGLLAFAYVNADGTLRANSFGISASSRIATGQYRFTLHNATNVNRAHIAMAKGGVTDSRVATLDNDFGVTDTQFQIRLRNTGDDSMYNDSFAVAVFAREV